MTPLPRVMAAVTQPGLRLLRPLLAGRCQLVPVFTLSQAMVEVRERIQLVMCSLDFDESRMFDLLSFLRNSAPNIPVVCVCLMPTQLGEAAMQDLRLSASHLGAVDFLDMRDLSTADYRTRNEFAERIISRLSSPPEPRARA